MADLQGKVALITGAGRRIGRAIALALAQAGADTLLHVHTSSAEAVHGEISQLGRRAWIVRADLSQPEAVRRLACEAREAAGRIDILVNNAAVFFSTPVSTLGCADWARTLRTNLSAPFLLSLLVGRHMYRQGHGKIIFLGDWSGQRPSLEFLAYCVSKSGIHALTPALAKAFAPHVQVNEIAPGPVLVPEEYAARQRTRMRKNTPLQRFGDPQDVARVVRFLAECGDFVTGATYGVDGGWLAKGAGGSGTSL